MKNRSMILIGITLASIFFSLADQAVAQVNTFKNSGVSMPSSKDGIEEANLLQAMKEYRFSQKNINQVRTIVSLAKKEKLPMEPVTNKIYEGIAKNIDQDRIVVAAETVRSRYANAYKTARNLSDNTTIQETLCDLVANAYAAGLKTEDSSRIVAALQTRTSTMNKADADKLTIQVWTTARAMAYRSVRSETIGEMTENAINCGFGAAEMRQVRNAFERQARYGSAENAARSISSNISTGRETGISGRSAGSGSGNSGGAGNSSSGSGDSSGSGNNSNGSGSSGGSGGSGGGAGGSGGNSGGSGGSGRR
ncbi:hypothetical protein [Desulfogranum japonicum]|uniref:hypothetical protein n=1 Tax=Desulfogranum japonicum TaxID=231447 RepID=UPI000404D87F|nr:hypothetical protein [Desulfogranum japonicum]